MPATLCRVERRGGVGVLTAWDVGVSRSILNIIIIRERDCFIDMVMNKGGFVQSGFNVRRLKSHFFAKIHLIL
jgi:hypothetical protein